MASEPWKAMGMAVLFLAIIAPRAWGQFPEKGWEFQLEPMRMAGGGWDEHVGDIVKQTVTTTATVVRDLRDREPINLDLDPGFALRGSAAYRQQQWGAGVAAWFFDTDDSVSGRVTTHQPTTTATSTRRVENFVSLWKEPRGTLLNELEPSGQSPFDFRVEEALNTITLDFFAFRTLAETRSSRIDLIAGVKVGRLDTEQDQGVDVRAFIFDDFGLGSHFNNFVSLSSTAEAKFLGAGPMVGFSGQARWRQLGFRAFVTHSLLIRDADLNGTFTDIDDISSTPDPAGPFTPVLMIRSDLPFSKSETAFIPVTEFQLAAKWHIMNRPGFPGGSISWEDGAHGKTKQILTGGA